MSIRNYYFLKINKIFRKTKIANNMTVCFLLVATRNFYPYQKRSPHKDLNTVSYLAMASIAKVIVKFVCFKPSTIFPIYNLRVNSWHRGTVNFKSSQRQRKDLYLTAQVRHQDFLECIIAYTTFLNAKIFSSSTTSRTSKNFLRAHK